MYHHASSLNAEQLRKLYIDVRKQTEDLCHNLEEAEYNLQAMEDTSPAKWHLAHVSWFFETFLLKEFVSGCFWFARYFLSQAILHVGLFRELQNTAEVLLDRRISGTVSLILISCLPFYIGYESSNPVYFDKYSSKLMILIIFYFLSIISFLGIFIYVTVSRKRV